MGEDVNIGMDEGVSKEKRGRCSAKQGFFWSDIILEGRWRTRDHNVPLATNQQRPDFPLRFMTSENTHCHYIIISHSSDPSFRLSTFGFISPFWTPFPLVDPRFPFLDTQALTLPVRWLDLMPTTLPWLLFASPFGSRWHHSPGTRAITPTITKRHLCYPVTFPELSVRKPRERERVAWTSHILFLQKTVTCPGSSNRLKAISAHYFKSR